MNHRKTFNNSQAKKVRELIRMKVTVKFLPPINDLFKRRTEEFELKENASLKDLIYLLFMKYDRHIKDYFFDDELKFKPKFMISVNGECITNLYAKLRDGDHIYFLQLIAGG